MTVMIVDKNRDVGGAGCVEQYRYGDPSTLMMMSMKGWCSADEKR